MGRNIIRAVKSADLELPEATGPVIPDNYTTQIVKLIPAEIVGVYLGLQNLFFALADPTRAIVQGILFVVILAISPLYLKKVGRISDPRQRAVAVISYCIWGISLGKSL